MRVSRVVLALVLWFAGVADAAAQSNERLDIATTALEPCVVDQPCYQQLRATAGTAPLKWRIVNGSFPDGLQLDPMSGLISGFATSAADYEVKIEVADSSNPPQTETRVFTSKTIPALTMDWGTPPVLQTTTISGTVTVSNNAQNVLDLTVIIVAVNETGKAFALGYQHFDLAAKTTERRITFSSQLPGGRYTVRADAIGEVAAPRKIYRVARQAGPFTVPAL